DPGHPVQAAHRQRARTAARHDPAGDQQVLRARSAACELVRALRCRAGSHGVHGVVAHVGADQGHLTWDDYLELGIMRAIDVALSVTGADKVNAVGFCVGGTMLGCAAAILAARGERKIQSLTFLTTMLDFTESGEIGLLIDEASVASREQTIGKAGIMPGRELAFVFSTLQTVPTSIGAPLQFEQRGFVK